MKLSRKIIQLLRFKNDNQHRFGVVVKTPARESVDPGFDSRLTIHRNCQRLLIAFVIQCDYV